VAVSPAGLLRGFTAAGHAGAAARGANVPCAAATVLLRTTGRLCAARGVALEGAAEQPGRMSLRLSPHAGEDAGWLRGLTDFLMRGLQDLQDEFPREVVVQVETTED
jgi:uncharacterized protein